MDKTIFFEPTLRNPSGREVTEYIFPFRLVDTDNIGKSDEIKRSSRHQVTVIVSRTLSSCWGLTEDQQLRVMFEYGKRHVVQKIRDGVISEFEELDLHTGNAELPCPFDPSRIENPMNATIRINNQHNEELRDPLLKPSTPSIPFRFHIALSFPGEFRVRVRNIAQRLAAALSKEKILYDEWYQAEFARPNLDIYLPKLYHDESLLLVFFLCKEYERKEWCGLEWRAGRDLLKRKEDDRIMFLRLDNADIPGLYSIDGYIDITRMSDDQVATEILERLSLLKAANGNPIITPSTNKAIIQQDPDEYWQQRNKLPETAILKKIYSRPRWRIWIRSSEFRKARFQSLDQCRYFVNSNQVRSRSLPYPYTVNAIESDSDWIAGEVDQKRDFGPQQTERWALFRSGQFVHNRSSHSVQMYSRMHVLEILDVVTGAFEFAARMSKQRVLAPEAVITFELFETDGLKLTWPQDALCIEDAVNPDTWCQDEMIIVNRYIPLNELEGCRRELSLSVALDIYSKFGWLDAPKDHFADQQDQRFGLAK